MTLPGVVVRQQSVIAENISQAFQQLAHGSS